MFILPRQAIYKLKIEKGMSRAIAVILVALLLVQCSKEDNLIRKKQLGEINHKTSIDELDRIFAGDSVVKAPEGEALVREYKVFDEAGELSLVFVTRIENDSIKALELVKIYSDYYVTEKGLSTASTFKDISAQYSIDKIEPSFSSAILFIDELNATISLDKSDLKIDEFDMRDIREDQIPDLARIRYITLWFE